LVKKNFVAQTGDPTGTGDDDGQSIDMLLGKRALPSSVEYSPTRLHNKKGLLSLSSTTGSQWFLTLSDRPLDWLDEKHTIFGEVIEGLDVVDRINTVFVDDKARPLQDLYIRRTELLDSDPFPDELALKSLLEKRPRSPVAMPSYFATLMRGVDAADSLDGKQTDSELERKRQQDLARARALTLQLLGERQSADQRPDERTLFVCRLNPVTEAEDLKMIFSRFGKVERCDVPKDRETNRSLGYAFIQFATMAACEEAFVKMDNVLIDDRRIKVDFSQSVKRRPEKYSRDDRRDARSRSPSRDTHRRHRARSPPRHFHNRK